MKNFSETMRNIERFLDDGGHNMYGKSLNDNEGFIAEIVTPDDRTYFEKIQVDRLISALFFEIYPGITCKEEYRGKVCEYLASLNASRKVGNWKLNDNQSICFHLGSSIYDAAPSVQTLKNMEDCCMAALFTSENVIDQLAHGIDTAEEEETIKKQLENLRLTANKSDFSSDRQSCGLWFCEDENVDNNELDIGLNIRNENNNC